MSDPLRAFGKALREARLRRGLSTSEFAELAGVRPRRLAAIERGDVDVPFDTLCELAEATTEEPGISPSLFARAEQLEAED
jgi:transcriptional regulator with XRE-family HTH domain